MSNILITGASGNIGFEIIRGLHKLSTRHQIIAADLNPDHAKNVLGEFTSLQYRKLDFADPATFADALEEIDKVFLLRPPQLADVPKYFEPFVDAMLDSEKSRKLHFYQSREWKTRKGFPLTKLKN